MNTQLQFRVRSTSTISWSKPIAHLRGKYEYSAVIWRVETPLDTGSISELIPEDVSFINYLNDLCIEWFPEERLTLHLLHDKLLHSRYFFKYFKDVEWFALKAKLTCNGPLDIKFVGLQQPIIP